MSGRHRAAMMAAARTPTKTRGNTKVEKEKEVMMPSLGRRLSSAQSANGALRSRREQRIALKQDVDRLKKRLRHEEHIHQALERAFTRPLGTLPRLPPYLPPQMLELLAEVAVLEEEVVRLEEQVVHFRWGIYQEAIYISSSKKIIESVNCYEHSKPSLHSENPENSISSCNDHSSPSPLSSAADHTRVSNGSLGKGKGQTKKPTPFLTDQSGKENQATGNSPKVKRLKPQKKLQRISHISNFKLDSMENPSNVGTNPNRISEDLLKCLTHIFSKMSLVDDEEEGLVEMTPSVSGFLDCADDASFWDPYGICSLFGKRDIGPYKCLRSIDQNTIKRNLITDSSAPMCKLRLLLRKLELVDLQGLNHQEKLAFWINVYNACMMNTFLEHGIPATPQMLVTQMQKAVINVSGHLLSAIAIEHLILRHPFDSKYAFSKASKKDEMATRSNLGLDFPEPLVTFALSCGSWSSPAVKVYTASQVESELQTAKSDYLQATIGISHMNKLAIPKLLDWYLLDFAKDIESLLDWICLQLPSGLRNDAVKCIVQGRRGAVSPHNVMVLPYEFMFRYLFAI